MTTQKEEKPQTAFVSEGSDWVEIDSENNEISRSAKRTFDTGHLLKTFASYAAKTIRDISGVPSGSSVSIIAIPGGKLVVLHLGEQIHIDANEETDFEYDYPINMTEDAPDEKDDKNGRQKAANSLKGREAFRKMVDEHAITGVDIIAKMLEDEQIDIKPEDAKVEIFHGNGTHSDDGCVVIYDDSKILKIEKINILRDVKSKRIPGFIVSTENVVSLLYIALQSREILMSPNATMQTRLGISSDLFDILYEIGII